MANRFPYTWLVIIVKFQALQVKSERIKLTTLPRLESEPRNLWVAQRDVPWPLFVVLLTFHLFYLSSRSATPCVSRSRSARHYVSLFIRPTIARAIPRSDAGSQCEARRTALGTKFREKFSSGKISQGETARSTDVSSASYPAMSRKTTTGRWEVSRSSREFDGRSIPEIEKDVAATCEASKCRDNFQ